MGWDVNGFVCVLTRGMDGGVTLARGGVMILEKCCLESHQTNSLWCIISPTLRKDIPSGNQLCWSSSIDRCTGIGCTGTGCTGTPSKDTMSAILPIPPDAIQPMHWIPIVFRIRHQSNVDFLYYIFTTSEILVTFLPCILQFRFHHFSVWRFRFLATLVALHFTPVSKSLSQWVSRSFGLA